MILVIIGAQGSGKSTLARVVDDFSRERDKMCASTILVEDWVPNETTRAQAARWTLADRVILTTQQLIARTGSRRLRRRRCASQPPEGWSDALEFARRK